MLRSKSTPRETALLLTTLNFLLMGDDTKRVSAAPLFEKLDSEKGASAKFAIRLNTAQGRIANWRRRGVPPAMLPEVADYLGITVDDYLARIGRRPTRPAVIATAAESPEVTRLIKAFAWLMDDERHKLLTELESRAAANKAIAKQLGPRFAIASDKTMLAVLQRGGDFPPGSKKKTIKGAPKSRRGQNFKEEDPE